MIFNKPYGALLL